MKMNTLKTTLGFLVTMLEKTTPLNFSKDTLDGVYNYLPVSETLSTSGQPTEAQFAAIHQAGFETVVNLAPHSAENSLADEAGTLSALGIRYIHIPVDFKHPTDEDFAQFAATMGDMADQKTWVHCAANMRVSAFVYRYRCTVLEEDRSAAKQDLDKIWEPFGVWKQFLSGLL